MDEAKRQARLELCRTCLNLRGPFHDGASLLERVQPCSCDPRQPLWDGYDYNRGGELCHCCAAESIRCGSRWSGFFCEPCKPRVLAFNEEAERYVIPLGRHSLLNGAALCASSAGKRESVESLNELFGPGGSIDTLHEHHRAHVRRIVAALPESRDAIPISVYLEHARTLSADRDATFTALVSAMTAPRERPPGI